MRPFSPLLAAVPLLTVASFTFAQSHLSFQVDQNASRTGLNGATGAAAQADFNNDGKPDLFTEDRVGNAETFNLRLGNGDGTFRAPINIGASTQLDGAGVVAVDLNHDGILDIVASFYNGTEVDVLFGKGGGSFAKPIILPVPAFTYAAAVTGDFNGDGLTDIAVGDGAGNVEIFQNTGNGSFTLARTLPVAPNQGIYSLAAGDVDHDGHTDLAISDGTNSARILWGLGNNDFHAVTLNTYPLFNTISTFITLGDLNQDGSEDVLVSFDCAPAPLSPGSKGPANQCTGVDVYYGGQGKQTTFYRRAVADLTVNTTFALTSADVNGDGLADLVAEGTTAGNSEAALAVWLGNPDGSFEQTARTFHAQYGGSLLPLVTGDFNRDGRIDFLANSGVYLNATDQAPTCAASRISPTVLTCQPVDNTYIAGPLVNAYATAYDRNTVTALQEYADGALVYSQPVSKFGISLREGVGPHLLVTKAWDANGVSFRTNRHITVYAGTPGAVCPSYGPGSADICLPVRPDASSPVRILANGSTSDILTAAQLYIDGNLKINDTSQSTFVDTTQTLSSGTHEVVFKLFDASGNSYVAERTLSVQ